MRRMYSENQLQEITKEQLANGNVNNVKVFENIVDSDGHARFIEGDIVLKDDLGDGITKTYGKWSLSGTHLLFVMGVDFADTYSITNGTTFAIAVIPSWIHNKIVNLFSVAIDTKTFAIKGDDWSSQNVSVTLSKATQNQITMFFGNNVTVSGTKHARFTFDLLID